MLRYLSCIDGGEVDNGSVKVQTLDFKFSAIPDYSFKDRECDFPPGKLKAYRDLISEQLKMVHSLLAAVGQKRTISVSAELRSNDGGWLADVGFGKWVATFIETCAFLDSVRADEIATRVKI